MQDRAAGLDNHNLVYYEHEGKTYLLPREMVADYEAKVEGVAKAESEIAFARPRAGSMPHRPQRAMRP